MRLWFLDTVSLYKVKQLLLGCAVERLIGDTKQQPLLCPIKKYCTMTSENRARRLPQAENSWDSSLLGLLAEIRRSICSYQVNICYVLNEGVTN